MANLNIPSTRDRTLDAFKGKMVGFLKREFQWFHF